MDVIPPERMSFTNLATGETVEAPMNPSELNEALKANWEELEVLGLPHKVQQYKSTDSHALSFTIRCDAHTGGQNKAEEILRFRRFLLSLFYSRRGQQGITGGAPPRFLFVWPSFVTMTCKIDAADFKHTHFSKTGSPLRYDVTISIKEMRDVRLYSEDLITEGTVRS